VTDPIEAIARAMLYEGYLLYPYRPSSVKNRVRWTFGGLFPRDYAEATGGSERWQARTECIVLDLRGGTLPLTPPGQAWRHNPPWPVWLPAGDLCSLLASNRAAL
jgi:hypothetical protein